MYYVFLQGNLDTIWALTLAAGQVFLKPSDYPWACSVQKIPEPDARALLQLATEAGLKGYASSTRARIYAP